MVYDLETHQAHSLNSFASRLWEACDGRRTVARLQAAHSWSERDVVDGLESLAKARLLVEEPPASPSRRRAIVRLAQAAALPAVISIMVPEAASAQSCLPFNANCTTSIRCCTGCCKASGPNKNRCRLQGPGDCFVP